MKHVCLGLFCFIAALSHSNELAAQQPRVSDDGEVGHNAACSVFEVIELEIKGERFHCPQYAPPTQHDPEYWPEDYDFDNPFLTDDIDDYGDDCDSICSSAGSHSGYDSPGGTGDPELEACGCG